MVAIFLEKTLFQIFFYCFYFSVETLDFESLYEKLELFSDFEKQANSRVVESGLLGGMNLGDIKRAGEHLILQDGCRDFFQKVVSNKEKLNSDLYMISYCWCADLIRSAFPSGTYTVTPFLLVNTTPLDAIMLNNNLFLAFSTFHFFDLLVINNSRKFSSFNSLLLRIFTI